MTWSDASRALAFWCLCLPMRIALAYMAVNTRPETFERRLVALILLGLGVSQLYLYAVDRRTDAPEGGGETWWAPARVIFGAVFVASAAVAYRAPSGWWRYLPYTDPVLGVIVWLTMRPSIVTLVTVDKNSTTYGGP